MEKHQNEPESDEQQSQVESGSDVADEPENELVDSEMEKVPEVEAEELSKEDELRNELAELEDKLLRTAAEFDNYKKRVARQYEDMTRSVSDGILLEILEVVDNFERALDHGDENSDFESYRKGVELIFNQMKNLLAKYDVTPIDAVGQPFDPNLHEAMMQIESSDYEEGVVAMEISRGYRQGRRVLRHSKVGVSTGEKDESNN